MPKLGRVFYIIPSLRRDDADTAHIENFPIRPFWATNQESSAEDGSSGKLTFPVIVYKEIFPATQSSVSEESHDLLPYEDLFLTLEFPVCSC